jgi:hypothetical protein
VRRVEEVRIGGRAVRKAHGVSVATGCEGGTLPS